MKFCTSRRRTERLHHRGPSAAKPQPNGKEFSPRRIGPRLIRPLADTKSTKFGELVILTLRVLRGAMIFSLPVRQLSIVMRENLRKPRKLSCIVVQRAPRAKWWSPRILLFLCDLCALCGETSERDTFVSFAVNTVSDSDRLASACWRAENRSPIGRSRRGLRCYRRGRSWAEFYARRRESATRFFCRRRASCRIRR